MTSLSGSREYNSLRTSVWLSAMFSMAQNNNNNNKRKNWTYSLYIQRLITTKEAKG